MFLFVLHSLEHNRLISLSLLLYFIPQYSDVDVKYRDYVLRSHSR